MLSRLLFLSLVWATLAPAVRVCAEPAALPALGTLGEPNDSEPVFDRLPKAHLDRLAANEGEINVALTWDADSDPDVIGYRVSVDEGPPVMVGDAEYSTQLAKGPHTLAVKAVDFRLVESLPAELAFEVHEFALVQEESEDQQAWTVRNREVILTARPQKFYRIRIE